MSSCSDCTLAINKRSPGVQCVRCDKIYHIKCANLSTSELSLLQTTDASWKCLSCRDHGRRSLIMDDDLVLTSPSDTDPKYILMAIEAMKKEIMREVAHKHEELMRSVSFCSDKITDFEKKLENLNDRFKKVDKLMQENDTLKREVNDLNKKISDMEQHSRRNNLEIQNFPETKGENMIDVIAKIGELISCPVTADNIDAVHRVPHVDKNNNKPKNIIVRFITRHLKDKYFYSAKQFKGIPATQLGFPNALDKIFVNEHLSPTNKILYKQIRDAAKAKGYKYIWVKNAKFFVKKNETSRPIHIATNADMIKI